MNWSKGKNKLIILFLSINILLGWANYRKDSSAYVLKETQLQDIAIVLEANNIFLDTPMPKRYKPLPKLTVFPFQIDSGVREEYVKRFFGTLEEVKVSIEVAQTPDGKSRRVYRQGDQVVIFEGEKILYRHEGKAYALGLDTLPVDQAETMAKEWLKKLGYTPRKMHMQLVSDSDYLQLNYYDKYQGIPVFDSYIKITMTSSGVKEIEIHKVELGESAGGKKEIYSVDQVFLYLIKLISGDEPTYIEDIMIGYALENPKGTHLIAEKALPFYQIILEDGRIYYINAYNSEIREEPQI